MKETEPVRQGGLDALCGLYSIVNALRYVGRREAMDDAINSAHWAAIKTLRPRRFYKAYHDCKGGGLSAELLEEVLGPAIEAFNIKSRIRVAVRPFDRPHYTMDSFIESLRDTLEDRNNTAIISFSGDEDHWTVVRGVSPAVINLIDSSGLTKLPIRLCKIRNGRDAPRSTLSKTFFIHAHESFMLSRETT